LRAFAWDCPKCGRRTSVDLAADEPATLVCDRCGWTVGQDLEPQRFAALADDPLTRSPTPGRGEATRRT